MRIQKHTLILQTATLLSAILIAILPACAPALRSPAPVPVEDRPAREDYFPKHSGAFYFNLLAAQMSINSGDWTNARTLYNDALEQAPGSPYILLQLSHLAMILREPAKAEDYCRLALENDPHFFDARRFMAGLLVSRGQTEEAIAEYRLLLTERPGDEETLASLAKLYAKNKQPEKALDVINELLAAHPNSATAFFYRGNIYADQGNAAEAEEAYRKSITLNPAYLPARINLAGLHETAGELTRAIEIYQDVAEAVPNNQLVRSKLAYLYVKTGNLDAARAHYQYLLDTAPQFNEEIALKIGLIYFEQENFADAEILFESIIEKNPANQHAQYYRGLVLEKMLNNEEAARAFQTVTPDSTLFIQARIQLAFIYSQNGKIQDALQILQEIIELKPDEASVYHALAVVYAENEDYQAAIAALQNAIKHDSAKEDLLLYLGHLYEKAGMFDESIAAMREVLAINNENADALNFIGYLYADRGIHLREARTLIKKAHAIKPDDGYILDSLGWVYFKMERYKKALKHLEHAYRLVPDDPTIAEHLGDVLLRMNKTEKALKFYRHALEIKPEGTAVQQKIYTIEQGL